MMWLSKVTLRIEFKMGDVEAAQIIEEVQSAISQCSWYETGVFEHMLESVLDALAEKPRGWLWGTGLPFVYVVLAAESAGCQISQSNNAEFNIYIIELIQAMRERFAALRLGRPTAKFDFESAIGDKLRKAFPTNYDDPVALAKFYDLLIKDNIVGAYEMYKARAKTAAPKSSERAKGQ